MKRFKMLFLLVTLHLILATAVFGQVDTASAVSYNQTVNIIFQIIFTVIGVFLSVVLIRLLARNGQVLKEIRDLGRRMDERTEKMVEKLSDLIVTESEKTRELIKVLKG